MNQYEIGKSPFFKTLNGKKSTVYIPTKYIRANTFSLEYGIIKNSRTALKASILKKSKTIHIISYGARLSIIQSYTLGMRSNIL